MPLFGPDGRPSAEENRFIEDEVVQRFEEYVAVHTTSDPHSDKKPSSARQMHLLEKLRDQLEPLGLVDIKLEDNGFVYATLPSNLNRPVAPFGLMAHVDTSPDQSGENVKPNHHPSYDGGIISFPDDQSLTLSQLDSPELRHFVGDTIITASGKTLLGADDKAGVAEIMAAMAAFQRFSHLPHGEITLCFTSDEEVGRGVEGIDTSRLPPSLYTFDGSEAGEIETECFDAWGVKVNIQGIGVHPGLAFERMVNAARIASLFVGALPADERPETTRERQGFYHVVEVSGNNEKSQIRMILRDFDPELNLRRLEFVRALAEDFKRKNPGLVIELVETHQYENMHAELAKHPQLTELATRAIEDSGRSVINKAIRGGTDGSRLTAMGFPTPNIFAGGLMFHSRKEWVPVSAMVDAVATIINLARRWSEQPQE